MALNVPNGTVIASPITLGSSSDVYPTHLSNLGKGGLVTLDSIADRNAIPLDRREHFMEVTVLDGGIPKKYRLTVNNWLSLSDLDKSLGLSNNANWLVVAEGGVANVNDGSGTTITGNSVDLGGTLTDDVEIDGGGGSYAMQLGSLPNQQFQYFGVGSINGINLLNFTDNIPNATLSLFSSGAVFGNMPDGFAAVFGKTVNLSAYDNRTFIIVLYAGIPSGSGESFTINGITFTEGIDFVGQNDKVLDLATIAGLNYSGVTDFISLEHIPGNDYVTFNFTQPAETSQTFSNGYIGSYLYITEVRCNENGLFLKSGTTELVINNNNDQTVFTDNTLVPQGIQYDSDYSANYTNRSLVDKEYVDGVATLNDGNGTTANGTSIDLGGSLSSDVIIDGLSGTYSIYLGSNNPNQLLNDFNVGTKGDIQLFDYDNRKFTLILFSGIAPGSGDSFTINGVTFTEGIDFIGQNNLFLDAEAISELVYTGVTDFISVEYVSGEVLFKFATPATTSSSLTYGYILENQFSTQLSLTENGARLSTGNTELILGNLAGNNVFNDDTSNQAGIQYGADYSANYSARSLVDKSYVDGRVASSINYRGGYDAATNTPDLDTAPSGIQIGDMYAVTVAGTFFTTTVEVGDVILSEIDNPTLETDWTIINKNLDDASIKAAYENNADTNAFTDAEKTKLAGLSGNNLGNANLTSTSAARTYSLYGNTSSDYLSFTDGTNTILKIKGDGYVGIGITTASAALNVYHATDAIVSKFQKGAVGNAVIQVLNSTTSTYYGLSTAGDDNGFSVGSSSDLLTNAYLRVLNSDGRLIHGLSSTAIADARLWNNSVNLYTDGSLLKARYKNNVGVASELTVGSNIANSNLTSSDDSRTFTLKSGGTASQNFQILNSGGGNLLKLSGNKAIDFGSGTNTINPKFYLDGDVYQYFSLYNKTNANSICDIFATASYANGVFYLKNAAGNTKISMNAGVGGVYTETAEMTLAGPYSSYRIFNSIGNNVVDLRSGNTNNGEFYLCNSSGTYKVQIAVGGSVIDTNLKVGGSFASATAALQIVGAGSTSATTTALFQNASGNNTLKILDDGNISNNGALTNSSTNSIAGGHSSTSVNNRNAIAWGEGAVANGAYSAAFGASTVSGYGGLTWGNYNSVTGNAGAAAGGQGNTASGGSSFAMGINNTASGTQSTALGLQSVASGLAAMSMGYASTAAADYSGIFAGFNNVITALATHSAIVGGTANTINASVLRSVILGGTGITATASDTAYALNLSVASVIDLGHASDTTISRVSAGVVAVEGVNIVTTSSTDTLTNKRVTPRVGTATSSATPTINTDIVDYYELTAQAVNITSFTTNLTGTPTNGQKLWIAITGTAARTIAWGASFESSTITLPTTTVTTNRLDVGFVWNSATSKWRCVGTC